MEFSHYMEFINFSLLHSLFYLVLFQPFSSSSTTTTSSSSSFSSSSSSSSSSSPGGTSTDSC